MNVHDCNYVSAVICITGGFFSTTFKHELKRFQYDLCKYKTYNVLNSLERYVYKLIKWRLTLSSDNAAAIPSSNEIFQFCNSDSDSKPSLQTKR